MQCPLRFSRLLPALLGLVLFAVACGSGGNGQGEADATSSPGNGEGTTASPTEAAGSGCETDRTYDLQYATFVGPNNPTSEAIEWWGNELETRSDGAISVEYFYQGSLLGGGDTLQGVGDGRADLGQVGAAFYPDLSLSAVVAVPFVTSNADAQMRAFDELYAANEDFQNEWEERGVQVLAFPPNTPNIIGTQEPFDAIEDLEGMQVRASGFISEALTAISANAVALPSPEIYESIQRGVIDAYSGFTFDYIVDFKLHEVAPHTTDTGLGNYVMSPLVITKDLWDEMPTCLQDIVTETSQEFMDESIELLEESDTAICDTLLEAGGTVNVLPEEEYQQWEEAIGDSIYNEWAQNVPDGVDADAFFQQYTDILAQAESETSYVPGVQACAERSS